MARRQWYGGDGQLSARMFFTMFLLGVIYLAFMTFLFFIGIDPFTMIVIAAILLGIQYFASDKLVLLSMGAREVSREEAPELHAIVERLAAMADIPKPKVAIVDADIPNAFATGRDPGHAVVAVTTGITRRLNKEELEAVLAHELTHVKNRDVMVITLASFFSVVAQFIMRFAMFGGAYGGGERRRDGSAALIVFLVSILVWIVSFILIRTLSRYRELAADRGGAIITGAPSRLASALLKISGTMQRIPDRDLRQVEAMNAFFIIPAIRGNSIAELFSTHPPLEKRLEQLKRLEQQMERP